MKIIKKKKLPKLECGGLQVLNEVEVLKELHHPNIVHLREVIDDANDGNLYLVMQYLPGVSL
jgi:serine/threonine protein kinase